MIKMGGEWRLDQLDNYLLTLLNGFKTPRKTPFIYAIMTGKRTGQAVQDIHLFQMEGMFGLAPTLARADLEHRISYLKSKQLIQEVAQGYQALTEQKRLFPIGDFRDFTFTARAFPFFSAWKLAVQVASNWKHEKDHYLPVVRDIYIQKHIKHWLAFNLKHMDKQELRKTLYAEMELLFDSFPKKFSPELLVRQFSGGKWTGLTMQQQAREAGTNDWDIYFNWLMPLHFILYQLEKFPEKFPLLKPLLPSRISTLTQSTAKTFQLFETLDVGERSVEMLANKRELKESTIHDHFVELRATFENLIVPELPDEASISAIKQGKYVQLKAIKEAYPALSYYQIRLAVVSKEGKEQA